MRILEEARTVLATNGYFVSPVFGDTFEFEDETLVGFVCEASLKQIAQSWNTKQDQFIKDKAPYLRKSALKSWNLYSVFLSSDPADDGTRRTVAKIEEDFRATRKIVQVGITTPSDVTHALYPFIPIQNVVDLNADDLRQKLSARLSSLPKEALQVLLDRGEDDILRRFLEAHETKSS
jgi:hypothetical protein